MNVCSKRKMVVVEFVVDTSGNLKLDSAWTTTTVQGKYEDSFARTTTNSLSEDTEAQKFLKLLLGTYEVLSPASSQTK